METTYLASGAERWIALACLPPLAALPLSVPAAVALAPLPLAVAYFFRDPDREAPDVDGVVSPADGRVKGVHDDEDGVRVEIFMRLHDVHVNRSPVDAEVVDVEHVEGGHLPAFSKASDRNERVETTLSADDGVYDVLQIAGSVARRITTYVDNGDSVERGERLGHIAFSSRVDLTFPEGYAVDDVEVAEGDVVRAGETVLAR